MASLAQLASAPRGPAVRIIAHELEHFLRSTHIRRVYFADGSTVPPTLAYVTNFPRLSLPLSGCHSVEIADRGRAVTIKPVRGHAVFVPDHAWNRPDWNGRADVLTFLFGVKQIGLSLVRQRAGQQAPLTAFKANIHGGYDVLAHNLLAAVLALTAENSKGRIAPMLVESLLHACLRLLKSPHRHNPRKAIRTYESICLYVQENFRAQITRETVARHFGLAPNHVSRLFRKEGFMRFNDYLNLVRVNRAKFMLQNYSLTLKEIAANCGYSDAAYFCRVFKKTSNITPTEYRVQSVAGLGK